MAAAVQNECPATFECSDVVGAEKSGCLARVHGDVPKFFNLSALFRASEED